MFPKEEISMKKHISLICALVLIMSMIVPGAMAVADTTCPCCDVTNVIWEEFTADTVPVPGGHYRLADDVVKKGQWTLETVGT